MVDLASIFPNSFDQKVKEFYNELVEVSETIKLEELLDKWFAIFSTYCDDEFFAQFQFAKTGKSGASVFLSSTHAYKLSKNVDFMPQFSFFPTTEKWIFVNPVNAGDSVSRILSISSGSFCNEILISVVLNSILPKTEIKNWGLVSGVTVCSDHAVFQSKLGPKLSLHEFALSNPSEKKLLAILQKIWNILKFLSAPEQGSFCHADFKSKNVLVRSANSANPSPFFIDFDKSSISVGSSIRIHNNGYSQLGSTSLSKIWKSWVTSWSPPSLIGENFFSVPEDWWLPRDLRTSLQTFYSAMAGVPTLDFYTLLASLILNPVFGENLFLGNYSILSKIYQKLFPLDFDKILTSERIISEHDSIKDSYRWLAGKKLLRSFEGVEWGELVS